MSWKRIGFASILTVGLNGVIGAAGTLTPPNVPTDIAVPAGHKLILVGHAVGTQNYICAPAATPTGVDWFFIGPQATLFDASGQQITTHFLSRNPFKNDALQATWQHSRDTSAVWAKKFRGSTRSGLRCAGCDRVVAAGEDWRPSRPVRRPEARDDHAHPACAHSRGSRAAGGRVHGVDGQHQKIRALRGRLLLLRVAARLLHSAHEHRNELTPVDDRCDARRA